MTIATTQVSIINPTLNIARLSSRPIAFINGLTRAKINKKVNSTTIWTIALLPFLNKGEVSKKTKPNADGISAVGEAVSPPVK